MPFLIAWRNVLKNRRRTIVTLILSFVATVFLIFYTSLFNGMFDKALTDAIEVYQGYLQIKGKGYRDKPTFENIIRNSDSIEQTLGSMKEIEDFTSRFETYVLLASEKLSIGAFFVGVDPKKETLHSKFSASIIKGRWLAEDDTNAVVIGQALAKKLKLKVGDEVSYISNAIDYSFTADNLKVVGVFDTGFVEMDKRFALVNRPYMDANFLTKGMATTIVILPKHIENVTEISAKFNAAIKNIDIDTWQSFVETILDTVDVKKRSAYVMFGVLYVIIFFVFMVYSMIAILARSKEIGIMRAIGTRPIDIIKVLAYESFIIGMAAVIVGGIIGGYLIWYLQVHPLVFTGTQIEEIFKETAKMGITIRPEISTVFGWSYIFNTAVLILVMNLLSIVYPTIKILRMKPIDEIHAI